MMSRSRLYALVGNIKGFGNSGSAIYTSVGVNGTSGKNSATEVALQEFHINKHSQSVVVVSIVSPCPEVGDQLLVVLSQIKSDSTLNIHQGQCIDITVETL
ncbi:hypothetical protein D9M71_683620 [compost metagenome]